MKRLLVLKIMPFNVLVAVVLFVAALPVEAATRCVVKSASGTGPSADVARFQVYEGLLRSVDSGLWAQWMAGGTTDGFKVGKPVYTCIKGMGLGISCTGRARICRT